MATDNYSLVEIVLGINLILWGAILLLNKHIIKSYLDLFLSDERNHETISYLTSTIFLIFGAVIISVHNDWYMGLSLITTLMGWILVVECFLWLAFNKPVKNTVKKIRHILLNKWMCKGYSLLFIVLGIAVLWNHLYLSI